ncbi:MAG: sulfite reductase subunit alpha [Burkholderiaceae bacterium]|uniref:NADPH--hemoprotein reductase n=1 Tax=Cupriavidus metallidurans TaxID=119219 RepID=A0A482J4F9_9BURK|nr:MULTISPECIES: sulfite reductase flavoprotein subunit alpha [Cupriavidus]KWR80686.1 sulfite reductase subunit alpha [Cupriavidus sp. SHE]PCH58651.1 MAG: sulfite reductase subunit alpha [Burkholderiaceae bacterium]QBP13930.1 sulfite reductase flavoprotein subunit alpha [Cupriavidus metallidurans]
MMRLLPWVMLVAGVALSVLAHGRDAIAAGVVIAYVGFCWGVLDGHRRHRAARAALANVANDGATEDAHPTLVAYASQTGFAEQLAVQTARALQGAGRPVQLVSFAELDGARLAACDQALFLVSTTGEGDAPDMASGFARRLLAGTTPDALRQLRYGVLALGDSSYAHFCAFGRALSGWLESHHAQPLFDRVEVDNGDPGALRHWQNHLSALSGGAEIADWERPRYGRWRLVERRLLNPGSQGEAAFHLALEPEDASQLAWRAGDIAEIGPCQSPDVVDRLLARLSLDGTAPVRCDSRPMTLSEALATRLPLPDSQLDILTGFTPQRLVDALPALPHREYSVASLPADGRLELLVRQTRHADGRLGLASGWLTEFAREGASIALRVRTNRSFHPPEDGRPLILIGNGTGLAGLRALIKARAEAGHHRNWLLFGERSAVHDNFHAEELTAWLLQGVLQRVDHAWSRDGAMPRYVQDAVSAQAATIAAWVEQGASIYVCGSLQGMAAGVQEALLRILGESTLQQLTEAGSYRRDVY